MSADSLVNSQAAAARAAYTASNWAAGDARFDTAAAAATARMPFDCVIEGFYALGPNLDRWRVLLGRDQSMVMAGSIARSNAAVQRDDEAAVKCSIPLKSQDTVTCQLENNNNNELNELILLLSKGKKTPPMSRYARVFPTIAAAAITSVAHTWTEGNLTLEATLNPNKQFDVLGMAFNGATCVASRLKSRTPQLQDDPRPTVISGLTAPLAGMTYFNDVLRFRGDQVPTLEVLDHTQATAQQITLLLGEHP